MKDADEAEGHGPRLEALIAKSEAARWAADEAIDWSAKPVRPRFISPGKYRAMVSQLYHGERATLAICERLIDEVPDTRAVRFLATQIDDERRHAQTFARYLEAFGGIAPADPGLGGAFARALEWDGPWQGLAVAANVVLEAETVRLLQRSPRLFSCPQLREINDLVTQDEARHLAFGRTFVARHLTTLSPEERLQIYDWVLGLWRQCIYTPRGGLLSLVLKIKGRAVQRLWEAHNTALCQIGLVSESETVPA